MTFTVIVGRVAAINLFWHGGAAPTTWVLVLSVALGAGLLHPDHGTPPPRRRRTALVAMDAGCACPVCPGPVWAYADCTVRRCIRPRAACSRHYCAQLALAIVVVSQAPGTGGASTH